MLMPSTKMNERSPIITVLLLITQTNGTINKAFGSLHGRILLRHCSAQSAIVQLHKTGGSNGALSHHPRWSFKRKGLVERVLSVFISRSQTVAEIYIHP